MDHIRESLRKIFEVPSIDNEPMNSNKKMPLDYAKDNYEKEYDFVPGYKLGFTSEKSLVFMDIIDDERLVVGHADFQIIEYEGKTFAVISHISIHPTFQGKGLAYNFYKKLLDLYDGIISDKSLTKRAGKGSFHIWRKLSKEYQPYVVNWKDDWEPYGILNFKKVKNFDNWVKSGKGKFRLAIVPNLR